MRLILMRPIRGVLTSMVANGFDIGSADMIISEMAFAQSVGQYIPMDDTLLTKMVSAWKTMTKKRYIASSTRLGDYSPFQPMNDVKEILRKYENL